MSVTFEMALGTKIKADLFSTATQHSAREYQNLQALFRLNGRNYLVWSQLVRSSLKGKGNLGHLIGSVPHEDDPKFVAWDVEDSMIMSWFLNLV